jgi:hypothetical protein
VSRGPATFRQRDVAAAIKAARAAGREIARMEVDKCGRFAVIVEDSDSQEQKDVTADHKIEWDDHYSLHKDERYFGTIERTAISSFDHVSLEIHDQKPRDEGLAYLCCLEDHFGADHEADLIFNNEAIFTLITRPTRPRWPRPLFIYRVDSVPADNLSGEDSWEIAIAPTTDLSRNSRTFDREVRPVLRNSVQLPLVANLRNDTRVAAAFAHPGPMRYS